MHNDEKSQKQHQGNRDVENIQIVKSYHEETKHYYHKSANSLGYLDWANQPNPFRRFEGANLISLPLQNQDDTAPYQDIFIPQKVKSQPLNLETLAQFFEYSLAISAWKQAGDVKWALRINPSSGNLHPTEGYCLIPAIDGINALPGVYHYAPKEHGLEKRTEFINEIWANLPKNVFLIGLSSIFWREAWKYGERAFRYCQHDCGHAYMALDVAARILGWRINLLGDVSDESVSKLLGLNRKNDFHAGEEEVSELLLAVYLNPNDVGALSDVSGNFVEAIQSGQWYGKANVLSNDHHPWDIIEQVHHASEKPATQLSKAPDVFDAGVLAQYTHNFSAYQVIKKRRSAVDMDGATHITKEQFYQMLLRVSSAFSGISWEPKIHLCLFVHRVKDLVPGMYMLIRKKEMLDTFKKQMSSEFKWEKAQGCPEALMLYCLKEGDFIQTAKSISCTQDIAGDGVFSLGMIAQFDESLNEYGAWFYKRLFWETGMIGQLLYLEAEDMGISATGIGCFFDEAVHEMCGFKDEHFQSLYHFTLGGAVVDNRLTTLAAYEDNR